ncbi:MAG: hypothetical protein WBE83_07160 [Candidatus Cybelea sp.]|jgi:hypothetical protein
MRRFLLLAALLACPTWAFAQTNQTASPVAPLEGLTLGEPMAAVRDTLGDPLTVASTGSELIWRYVGRGGAFYVDVLVKNNVAYSVTVVRRYDDSAYTDPRGVSFGMTSGDVRAKLGTPAQRTTNSDDGSVDLWYVAGSFRWIYEFYSDRLGFIQVTPSPALRATFVSAPEVTPADGSSAGNAIKIRPSNALTNALWINAYLAMNQCGSNGHWKELSLHLELDSSKKGPPGLTVVRARCTDGATERTFYFDTPGDAAGPGAGA